MRSLTWTLRITLFLLLLGFAVKNTDPVVVYYYFGQQWQAPLVIVLLLSFCIGAVLGILASLSPLFRQRREISELKRAMRSGARTDIQASDAKTDLS